MATKEEIKAKVGSDPRWSERAIVAIYQYQTEDEKSTQSTSHDNKVGFSGPDAMILSSFAQQLQNGRHLSEKQLKVAFKLMPKYSGQLYRIAEAKAALEH